MQMSPRAERFLRKIAGASLILAASACLVLLILRVFSAISFVNPYMIVTTGLEEGSLLSLWKFTQHQAVYSDPRRIPFSTSDFNWGYYFFYGSVSKVCLKLLHLDTIWIATIGRLITLVFTFATGGVLWLALRKFANAGFFMNRAIALAWCLIAATSPLVGLWSITTRPDMGALAFETAGLYVMMRCLRKKDVCHVIGAALLFYAAWAFKQSSVTMLTGSALALLLLKRWRVFFLLSGIWWFLVIVTLVAGGPIYRECLFYPQAHCPLLFDVGLDNASMAILRNPFLLPCFAAIIFSQWERLRLNAVEPIEVGSTLAVMSSFCFGLVTSCALGAVTNYYIPAAWVTMFAFALMSERINSQLLKMAGIVICSWLLIAGIARAHVDYGYGYRYSDAIHRVIAEKLSHLPGPVIASEPYANLPWMHRESPYFVIDPMNERDRAAGGPFERGGWVGLAEEGYFGTMVTDGGRSLAPDLLNKYELVDEYMDALSDDKFYRRIESEHH
jgi:hypothetical protein